MDAPDNTTVPDIPDSITVPDIPDNTTVLDTPDNIIVPPLLAQPSTEEALLYYAGLTQQPPRLVARASSDFEAWEAPVGDPVPLALANVMNPYILSVWATPKPDPADPEAGPMSLVDRVKAALHRLPFRRLAFIHLGLRDISIDSRPVVVWVGLDIGSHLIEPWPVISDAVRSVRALLDKEGMTFADVQV